MNGAIEDDLRRAREGDARAIERLLVHYLPGLRAYVRLRAGDALRAKESVSDLVQSVCLELLAELPRFEERGEAALRGWLYRAAERKVKDRARYWRAQKRDVARAVSGGEVDEHALLDCYRSFVTPSRVLRGREELALVESAFSELPEHYREVILSSRLIGLSHAEIAARMGGTESAARNLLYRALAALSERLGPRHE